jgi:hypothetical protein
MVYVSKSAGYAVIVSVIYVIHYIVFYQVTLVKDMLDEVGEHENAVNFIFGWPIYIIVMTSYILSSVSDPGAPAEYLKFYRVDIPRCEKCDALKPVRTFHCTRCR